MAAAARLIELATQEEAKLKAHAAILAPAAKEKRPLTAEERTQADDIEAEIDAIRATVKAEKLQGEGPKAVITGGAPAGAGTPQAGFANHREFLTSVIRNSEASSVEAVSDARLKPLAQKDDKGVAFLLPSAFASPRAAVGSDEHGVYDNRYGGFGVAVGKGPDRPPIGFEGDPTDGLCEEIPMSAPTIEMDAIVDKNHTSSVSGGLTVSRRAETVAASASRQEMEKVTLKASSTFGIAYITNELMQDSPMSFAARVANGFELQFRAFKFNEKLRGLGGSERLGVLTALAASSLGPTISIAKETGQAADTFLYQNMIKMRARAWGYSSAIWIANHDCYPQLSALAIPVGVGGQLVYQQSLVEDRPDRLLGRPIYYSEYANTVGDQGDLILGNWSQYMEGEYKPLEMAESVHVRFLNHENTLKFFKRDTGAPSWKCALTPNKGSNTLSPFVVLDAR